MLLKFNFFLGRQKLCLEFCHYSVYVRDDNWAEMLFFRRENVVSLCLIVLNISEFTSFGLNKVLTSSLNTV